MKTSSSSRRRRVMFWTENYQIGGCDRYLTDLAANLDPEEWEIIFAGNANPWMDDYVQRAGLPDSRLTANIRSIPRIQASVQQRMRRHLPSSVYGDSSTGSPMQSSRADGTERLRQILSPPASSLIKVSAAFALNATYLPLNFRAMKSLLTSVRPDVVHINNGGYPAAESCRLMAIAARNQGILQVVHVVHNVARPPTRPYTWDKTLDRLADESTSAWVTAAPYTSEILGQARGFHSDRVHTIFYGIPSSPKPSAPRQRTRAQLGIRDEEILLAMIASFEPRKGHETLIRAITSLLPDDPMSTAKVVLVGEGQLRNSIASLVKQCGIEDRVIFTGWIDDPERILAAADGLVLPSLGDECLPYVILEAMQHCLPVVATAVAGIPEEVIDGVTGFLVPPADPTALSLAISRLGSKQTREAFGAAGHTHLRDRFKVERMVRETTALWST